MLLFPAIDLRAGRCVRLHKGDFAAETVYSDDPAAVAVAFAAAGAPWLHVVDLDAARTGELTNLAQVSAITAAVDVPVQYGGGVRSVEAAAVLAEAGVRRVVVGTAALENPALTEAVAARQPVALGLDVRGREVAVRGWRTGSGRRLAEMLQDLPDVEALIVTQINTDGTLEGPDTELLAESLSATDTPLIASGGVGGIEDLMTLAALRVGRRGLNGAIVGRALYERRLDVASAVAALARAAEAAGEGS